MRLRQPVTKGPGSPKRGLQIAFGLLEVGGQRWRRIKGDLPLVRAGVPFPGGEQLKRKDNDQQEQDTTERAAA